MKDEKEKIIPVPDGIQIKIKPPRYEKVPPGYDPMRDGKLGFAPLLGFEDILKGNDGIALGCGPSFKAYTTTQLAVFGMTRAPEELQPGQIHYLEQDETIETIPIPDLRGYWTVGVNRVLAHFRPDFALCAEDRSDEELWKIIDEADPAILFTTWAPWHRRGVRFEPNARAWLDDGTGRTDFLGGGMSTWYAAALLAYMGCETVGVLGVDLAGHSSFGSPEAVVEQDRQWDNLRVSMELRGQTLVNLSPDSLLSTLPKVAIATIRPRGGTRPPE